MLYVEPHRNRGGQCYADKDLKDTSVGPVVLNVDLVMQSDNVVWRISGANSMVRISRKNIDVCCLGFLDGGSSWGHRSWSEDIRWRIIFCNLISSPRDWGSVLQFWLTERDAPTPSSQLKLFKFVSWIQCNGYWNEMSIRETNASLSWYCLYLTKLIIKSLHCEVTVFIVGLIFYR